jgi:ADP-ribose diphosphatase
MKKLPIIHAITTVAQSRLFHVQRLDLEFSNGEFRQYERLKSGSHGAVMIVPILNGDTLLLVREYAAGTESYQLGFPKGLIEAGEDATQAGNREMKEEVGYGARKLTPLRSFCLAPGYLSHKMQLVLAEDLYPETLEGDEPEPLEVIEWPLAEASKLLDRDDFTEARSMAALYLLEQHFKSQA